MKVLLGFCCLFVTLVTAVGAVQSSSCDHATIVHPITNITGAPDLRTSTSSLPTTFVVTFTSVNGTISLVQPDSTPVASAGNCSGEVSCTLTTVTFQEPVSIDLTTTVKGSPALTLTETITEAAATSILSDLNVTGENGPTSSSVEPTPAPSSTETTAGSSATTVLASTPKPNITGHFNSTSVVISSTTKFLTSSSLIATTSSSTSTLIVVSSTIEALTSSSLIVTTTAPTSMFASDASSLAAPEFTERGNLSLVTIMSHATAGIPVPTSNRSWSFQLPTSSTSPTPRNGNGASLCKPPRLFTILVSLLGLLPNCLAGTPLPAAGSRIDDVISTVDSEGSKVTSQAHQRLSVDSKAIHSTAVNMITLYDLSPRIISLTGTGNGTFSPWWSSVRISTTTEPSTVTITSTTVSTTHSYITSAPTVNITEYITVSTPLTVTTTNTSLSSMSTRADIGTSTTGNKPTMSLGPNNSGPGAEGTGSTTTSDASNSNATMIGVAVGVSGFIAVLALCYAALM